MPSNPVMSLVDDKPLDHGELTNLAEQYVRVDSAEIMQSSHLYELSPNENVVCIVDAENEIVCWVQNSKAALMVRLLNSYESPRLE